MVSIMQVAAVVGIDNVESAIADARVNAELNGITNATFVCGAAEHVMEQVLEVRCQICCVNHRRPPCPQSAWWWRLAATF